MISESSARRFTDGALVYSLNITVPGRGNLTQTEFLAISDPTLNTVVRTLSLIQPPSLTKPPFAVRRNLHECHQYHYGEYPSYSCCEARSTVTQSCGSNDTCVCTSPAQAVLACEQCMFTELIKENRPMPDVLAGNQVVLTSTCTRFLSATAISHLSYYRLRHCLRRSGRDGPRRIRRAFAPERLGWSVWPGPDPLHHRCLLRRRAHRRRWRHHGREHHVDSCPLQQSETAASLGREI